MMIFTKVMRLIMYMCVQVNITHQKLNLTNAMFHKNLKSINKT